MPDIQTSTNYEQFHFLEMNRGIIKSHVRKLRENIDLYGFFGTLVVITTDLFAGTMMKYVIDGQHRFKALQDLGLPIRYQQPDIEFTSKQDIAMFIASLNSTSKPWELSDYMHAWSRLGIDNYRLIENKVERSGLTISCLIPMYELRIDDSRQSSKFKRGDFEIPNLEESSRLIGIYQDCITHIRFEHWTQERDFTRWIITNRPNGEILLDVCRNNNIPLEEFRDQLDRLYQEAVNNQ